MRPAIPVAVLILNDSAFRSITWRQENRGFRGFGLDQANPVTLRTAAEEVLRDRRGQRRMFR